MLGNNAISEQPISALATAAAVEEEGQLFTEMISDALNIFDGFARMQSQVHPEAGAILDEFRKEWRKRLDDISDVLDAAILNRIVARLASDLVEVVDGQVKQLTKPIGDDALALDVFTKLMEKTVPENQEQADNINRMLAKILTDRQDLRDDLHKLLAKRLGDQVDVSDLAALSVLRFLMAADVVTVADVFTQMLAKSIVDNQQVGDGFSKLLVKLSGDNFDIVDLARAQKLLLRTFADELGVSDALVKALFKIVGDSEDTSDQQMKGLFKVLGERQDVSDEATLLAIAAAIVLAISDQIDISDALRRELHKVVGEQGGVADELSRLLGKSITDVQQVADTANVFKLAAAIVLMLADTVDLSDVHRKELRKLLGEQGGIEDELSRLFGKSITDVQLVTDQANIFKLVAAIVLMLADTLALTDDYRKTLFKTVGDLEGIFDAHGNLLGKVMTDRADVADATTKLLAKVIAESIPVSDTFAKSLLRLLTAADNVDLLDTYVKTVLKVIADDEAMRDDYIRDFSKVVGESQPVRDAMAQALTKTLADSVGLEDAAMRMLRKVLTDIVEVEDEATLTRFVSLHLVEIIETQDVADEFYKQLFKAIAERIEVVDDISLITIELLREFIHSMVAEGEDIQGKLASGRDPFRLTTGDEDAQGKVWGTKPGTKIVAAGEDPLKRVPGTKGRRVK